MVSAGKQRIAPYAGTSGRTSRAAALEEDRFVPHFPLRMVAERYNEDVVDRAVDGKGIDRLRQELLGRPEEFEPESATFAHRSRERLRPRQSSSWLPFALVTAKRFPMRDEKLSIVSGADVPGVPGSSAACCIEFLSRRELGTRRRRYSNDADSGNPSQNPIVLRRRE